MGQTRRQFISTAALAVAAVILGVKYLVPGKRKERPQIVLPAGPLPTDGALVYRNERMAIVNNGGEIYALELICTHLGCTVSVTPDEIVCPCHGSRFDRRGNVLKGPADKPLKRFPVTAHGKEFVVLLDSPRSGASPGPHG